jgi:hypothetical protein
MILPFLGETNLFMLGKKRQHERNVDNQPLNEHIPVSRIEVVPSVEIIRSEQFQECTSLVRIELESSNHLKEIGGFAKCSSLHRTILPLSVGIITSNRFWSCECLNEVIFASDRVCQIDGFANWNSLFGIALRYWQVYTKSDSNTFTNSTK